MAVFALVVVTAVPAAAAICAAVICPPSAPAAMACHPSPVDDGASLATCCRGDARPDAALDSAAPLVAQRGDESGAVAVPSVRVVVERLPASISASRYRPPIPLFTLHRSLRI